MTRQEMIADWKAQEQKKSEDEWQGPPEWWDSTTPANQTTASHIQVSVALGRITTAQKILETEYPEPRWAVKGLIPQGVTFIAGPPKLGKSIFALNIAVAVAEGGRALSHFEVEPGSVLVLALEDGERRIQARLRQLTGGKVSSRLEIATEWPRLDQGGLEAIDAWIALHPDARLILVDTLKMIRPTTNGHNRNAYDVDYEAIQPLTKIASQRVPLCIIHHTRKAIAEDPLATVSGSYGLTGAADGVLVLNRRRNRSDATLSVIGRDVEEQELALEFKPEICLWSVLGKADDVKRSNERQDILDLFAQSGEPMAPGAIAELLDKPGNAVRFLLFKMKEAGEIKLFGSRYQLPTFKPPKPEKILSRGKIKNVSALAVLVSEDSENGAYISNGHNDYKESVTGVSGVSEMQQENTEFDFDHSANAANAPTDFSQTMPSKDIPIIKSVSGQKRRANGDEGYDPILEAIDD
jgi:hypothetical protein